MQEKIQKDLNSKTLTFALTFCLWTLTPTQTPTRTPTPGYSNSSSALKCKHAKNTKKQELSEDYKTLL